MVRRILITILCVFLFSCTEDKTSNKDQYRFSIVYAGWAKIDFKSRKIDIDRWGLKYSDTLHFTPNEQSFIIHSFNNSGINDIKGHVRYIDRYQPMPPIDLKIMIFKVERLQAVITIDWTCKKGIVPFGQRYKVLNFRDDLLKILENNKDFKDVKEMVFKYQIDNKILRL